MVRVCHVQRSQITPKLTKQLCKLTMAGGEMLECFAKCLAGDMEDKYEVFVAIADGAPVGWSLAYHEYEFDSYWSLHCYVRRAHRRQGIGSRLIRKAKQNVKNSIAGNYWNKPASKFFTKNGIKKNW